MAVSTIPAAIDALVVMFAAALPDVQVFDSDLTEDVADEYVGVSFADDDNAQTAPVGVTFDHEWIDLGARTLAEDYDIRCELSTWSGGGTLTERRTRAFAMLATLNTALRADPGLGGVISGSGSAHIASGQLLTGDTTKGPTCTLNFTVHVRNVRI